MSDASHNRWRAAVVAVAGLILLAGILVLIESEDPPPQRGHIGADGGHDPPVTGGGVGSDVSDGGVVQNRVVSVRVVDQHGRPLTPASVIVGASTLPDVVPGDSDYRHRSPTTAAERLQETVNAARLRDDEVIETPVDDAGAVEVEADLSRPILTAVFLDEMLSFPILHYSEPHVLDENETEVDLRIDLPPKVIVHGRITDESGAPAEDAVAMVNASFESNAWPAREVYRKGMTIAEMDGSYRIVARLRPCLYEFYVASTDTVFPKYEPFSGDDGSALTPEKKQFTVAAAPDEQVFNIDVVVQRARYTTITGRLLLEGGAALGPYRGVKGWVFFNRSEGGYNREEIADDGTFAIRLSSQRPGPYVLFLSGHPDYETVRLRWDDINPNDLRESEFDIGSVSAALKPVRIVGSLDSAASAAVSEIAIRERHLPETGYGVGDYIYFWTVKPAADGTFEFRADPRVNYDVFGIAENEGFASISKTLVTHVDGRAYKSLSTYGINFKNPNHTITLGR